MVEFYKHYIHPNSAQRAKLAVHLIAQGTAPAVVAAESSSTSEKPIVNATTSILEKGIQALGLNKTTKAEQVDGSKADDADGKKEINGTTPILITDVRDFKARLQISAGPRAVRELSEFEELSTKL